MHSDNYPSNTSAAPRFHAAQNVARTMTSAELLEIINAARAEAGEPEIRRNKFAEKIEDELEGEHYTKRVVQNLNKTESVIFDLTRDQCMLVSMRESKGVRRRVLARLNALEAAPAIPQTLPEALRLAADLAEQNNQLRLVVTEQAPKVEALARIANARGSMCMTDAAKHLGVQRCKMIDWMKANRWIYRREGCARWLAYQPRMASGWLEHKVTVLGLDDEGDQRLASQVRITPKGLAELAQKMGVHSHG
jgi:phage antirepressor YoqD-like protein